MSTTDAHHYRTLVPGDRKIPVTLIATYDGAMHGCRDMFIRYAEPMAYDEEHQTASTMAADALLNVPDVDLWSFLSSLADDDHPGGTVTVKVGGRVLYEETCADLLATLQRYEETSPAGDWPVGFGF